MAIPDDPLDEPPDESRDDEEAGTVLTVASANTMASAMTAVVVAPTADTFFEAAPALTVSAADTVATETGTIAEGQAAAAATTVFHLYETTALHGLDSEQDLASIENNDADTQWLSRELRASPVEDDRAAVAPTAVTAFSEPSRIRDGASGIIARGNNSRSLSSSPSSNSEDYESSSSEEGAVGGVTKRNCGRSVKRNLSKDLPPSSGKKGLSVDVASVTCGICKDRFQDTVCIPCGHRGCNRCIKHWLELSRSCHISTAYSHKVVWAIFGCFHFLVPFYTVFHALQSG